MLRNFKHLFYEEFSLSLFYCIYVKNLKKRQYLKNYMKIIIQSIVQMKIFLQPLTLKH